MHERQRLPIEVTELLRHQEGVVSRSQLARAGLSQRSIGRLTGAWWRLARGVYLAGPTLGRPPWTARIWAGVLLGGPGARACRLTAAALDGLASPTERLRDATGTRHPVEDEIEIMCTGARGPHQGFAFVRERDGVRRPSLPREPPRTRIEDTVLDLCAVADETDTVMWLTRACQRRLSTPELLRQRVDGRRSFRNRALALAVLDDITIGVTSNLEHRALHDVFRAHSLPRPRLQYRIGSHVVDAALAAHRLLIEFDGRIGHLEEGAFRDGARDNLHTLKGWRTLRYGWAEVTADPCGVARQIAAMLRALGWTGELHPCPRCRPPDPSWL